MSERELRPIVKRAYERMRADRQGRRFEAWTDWDKHAVDVLTREIVRGLRDE